MASPERDLGSGNAIMRRGGGGGGEGGWIGRRCGGREFMIRNASNSIE